MKRLADTVMLAGLCLALVGVGVAPFARACAPVMSAGGQVTIASESAVILWDEKTKTEHFIRRASFETKAPYFGFLVPTPSEPALAESPDELFTMLEDWSKPEVKIETVTRRRTRSMKFSLAMTETSMAPGGVQVVSEQVVGGFKAVVLKADDARKLKDWLEEHGYVTRPDLEKWLAPYIDKGWYLTAFQIAKSDKQSKGLATKAVRMTFKTDRPFYPYSEPGDQREVGAFHPDRLLRIFFIGAARMEGKLDHAKTLYPGKAAWANTLSGEQREKILAKIGGTEKVSLPKSAWLTVFDDHSSPRPGVADLFFSPSADQSTLARPPIIHYNYVDAEEFAPPILVWAGIIVLGGAVLMIGLVLVVWLLTRRGAPA